jgi:hypothetical protein
MAFRYYVEENPNAKKCEKKRIALLGIVRIALPPFWDLKNVVMIVDYLTYCLAHGIWNLLHPRILYSSLMASKCYIYFLFPKRSKVLGLIFKMKLIHQ